MKRRTRLRAALSRRYAAYATLLLSQAQPAWAELPAPCGGTACTSAGGPSAWISSGSVQAPVISGNQMTLRQLSGNAALNWQTFNISDGSSVEFKQPSASSISINRVWDASGNPAQILGKLTANGQIYLINRNGIIFGAHARVDAASLVASSLDITESALNKGLVRAFLEDRQPAFSATTDTDGIVVNGEVLIEAGASLRAQDGGQILVFAPNIVNNGAITSADGQTVLAAGSKIYLMNSSDDDLRGLVVEVDVDGVSDTQLQSFLRGELAELPLGRVANYGSIDVATGNASLVGLAVNQSGRISATTSVRANGTIYLRAADHLDSSNLLNGLLTPTRGGKAELGNGSVTEVLPDITDTATTVDINAQPVSRVALTGHSLHLGKDARITATGGEVDLIAQADPSINENALTNSTTNDSRILIEDGAVIDVSGATVDLPADRLLLEVELRAEEFKDSPVQRDGVLRGQTVTVDLRKSGVRDDGTVWTGTPLADLSGAVAAVERSVGERSVDGGTVKMISQGDVIVAPNALIDVAGGRIDYAAGQVQTTQLISNGRVYDISVADPDFSYDAIVGQYSSTSPKWGVTRTWQFPGSAASIYSAAFSEGHDAGSVIFNTPRLILDGDIDGSVVSGLYQRKAATAPQAGQLVVGYQGGGVLDPANYRSGAIEFRDDFLLDDLATAGFNPLVDELPDDFTHSVLRPSLFSPSGIGRGVILSNQSIAIYADTELNLPAGGSLALSAGSVDIAGRVTAPGGTIDAEAVKTIAISQPDVQTVNLRSGALLDASGQWVNDSPLLGGPDASPAWIDGGSVSLGSDFGDIRLESGARIDVAGGAWLHSNGKIEAGAGGDISLAAGIGRTLKQEAQLGAESLGRGGSLSISTNALCIGGEDCASAAGGSLPETLVLAPDFFRSGGFGSYRLTATRGDLVVAGDADVRPAQLNRVLDSTYSQQKTGADLEGFSHLELLPDYLRRATDISLSTTGAHPAELRIEQGASITADPGAKISLGSTSRLWMDGALTAPGGAIALDLKRHSSAFNFVDNEVIWLGADALLDTAGVTQLQPDALGLRVGEVLDGGRVSLSAQRGYVVAEEGSRIDVSGATDTLDLPNAAGLYMARTVASNAGTLAITAAEGAVLEGVMRGEAGGANALGGTLSLTLDSNARGEPMNLNNSYPDGGNTYPHSARTIEVVGDTGGSDLTGFTYDTLNGAFTQERNGVARLRASSIAQSGFDALELTARHLLTNDAAASAADQVRSPGAVSIGADLELARSLVVDAPTLAATADVTLSAPYVALGSTDAVTQAVPGPVAADHTLTVAAGWLDLIGASAVSGADRVILHSDSDLRLRALPELDASMRALAGSFTSAGDLEIEAAQLYPATLTDFTLTALDTVADAGSITVSGGGAAGPVLSAGGAVRLRAARIENQGVIKAPFGVIDLQAGSNGGEDGNVILAPGSLLSTSGDGQIIPFGRTEGGLDWIYDLGNRQKLVFGPGLDPLPTQGIRLAGALLDLQEGSRIDVSAGGDLQAYEFVPGVGGARDILALDQATDSYAILPVLGETIAPFDQEESADFAPRVGSTVHLDGSDGLPTGEYVLLPARYALLPGAWLITELPGYADLPSGVHVQLSNGLPVVSGRYGIAGTDQQESRTHGFSVLSSALLRDSAAGDRPAEYTLSLATQFLADGRAGVRLPIDAGTVALGALQSLNLRASLDGAALAGGRGAALDIAAENILITAADTVAVDAGVVPISAAALNALGAESVLLGGRRTDDAGGTRIDVVSGNVELAAGAVLDAPELLLAADDKITLAGGAGIRGRGAISSASDTFMVDGDGAFMRVSGGGFADIVRAGASGAGGLIEVASGATVQAAGAAIIDATANIGFDGELQVDGASVLIGAPHINLGAAPDDAQGFTIGTVALAGLGADELLLRGSRDINLYDAPEIQTKSLILDAPAVVARSGDTGSVARIVAQQVTLTNTAATATTNLPGQAYGRLEVAADDIRLALGEYEIAGFDSIMLSAGRTLLGRDEGRLSVTGGDLALAAGVIGGERGATTRIAVDGDVVLTGGDAAVSLDDTAIGAAFSIEAAGDIRHAGNIVVPAGMASLNASSPGGVTVASGAVIDASGVMRQFDTTQAFAPAGQITLTAGSGDVTVEAGAQLTVAGAASADGAGGDAGNVAIAAPQGAINLQADIDGSAAAGQRQGRIDLDGATITNLDTLNTSLNVAGFTDERVLRIRSGDVNLNNNITAQNIDITVDGGALTLGGVLNAGGDKGGDVRLAARGDITLPAGAGIDVSAGGAGNDGGMVEMMSREGGVKLLADSRIAAAGGTASGAGAAGADGSVLLRVNRDVLTTLITTPGNHGVALDGTLDGVGDIFVEGVKTYDLGAGDAVIGAAQTATFSAAAYTDADAFMQNADAIAAALGRSVDAGFHVRAGVELQAGGDLTLASAWDLYDWRFNGESGYLTLRAGGDLNINQDLSDGVSANFFNFLEQPVGDSWSYRLVAGADLDSASPFAVQGDTTAGDFLLAADTSIRTGTGAIEIAAAGDIRLADDTSVIYTTGVPVTGLTGELRDFVEFGQSLVSAALAEGGGDIVLRAGGDIVGAPSDQLVTDWLWRTGSAPGNDYPSPTMWGVEFSRFRQGVGALAGGDVTLRASGDVDNVSAVIPTIGVPAGATQYDNEVDVRGGGDLRVEAGGDIGGGIFYVGKGVGDLRAGGSIRAGTGWNYLGTPLHTTLALGDGQFNLTARQDLALETVFNPTLLSPSRQQAGSVSTDWLGDFSTYADTSAVRLAAVAGDVTLEGNVDYLANAVSDTLMISNERNPAFTLTIFPPSLSVNAFSGDIASGYSDEVNRQWIRLMPAAQGQVELLAQGDVRFYKNGILLSGADPALFPTPQQPQLPPASSDVSVLSLQSLFLTFGQYAYADVPVHSLEYAESVGYAGPRVPALIVAKTGDIDMSQWPASNALPAVMSAKPLKLIAGDDILDASVTILHPDAGDVSVISAGGDIAYSVARTATRQIIEQFAEISVDGPGNLLVMAGGDIDLKAAPGIVTRGNTVDAVLADEGADITVMAGIDTTPAYDDFIAKYLEAGPAYQKDLAAYLTENGIAADAGQELAVFRALPPEQQTPFLTHVLFVELRNAGRQAAAEGSADFGAGYTAIDTLFPGADPAGDAHGDLSLFFSRIYTLDGGDINAVVPTGIVNAGLSTPPASFGVAKGASKLGIVAQRSGDVNILSGNDTLVNASRVFAADGGSILMWSSAGNIDAGRGAKSAISAPAPVITYDANGLPSVEFPPALTGSGIRAFVTTLGREPGDVDLYAPVGVINAGDAGIGSAGNVTVAATEVIGADNIDIGGVAVGVPVADTGSLAAGLTGVSNVASAATSASEEALGGGSAQDAGNTPLADAAFAVLDVIVLGFGDEGTGNNGNNGDVQSSSPEEDKE